jgi:hypothetical protein
MRLLFDSAHDHQRLAKIGLCRARRMRQRNEHLLLAQRGGPYVVLHDRVSARVGVLRRTRP